MPAALPSILQSVLPAAGSVPASVSGVGNALLSEGKPGGEANGGVFAALMGAELQPLPSPMAEGIVIPNKAAQALASGPEGKGKAIALALGTALQNGVTKASQAITETPAPSLVVLAGPPAQPLNDDQLAQAAGGTDDSAEAADAAIVAAIETGIAPVASERLVLATSLPVAIRSSTSVRVLDQLLDHILPAAQGGAVSAGTNPVAIAARTAEQPVAATVLAAVQDGVTPELPTLPAATQKSNPENSATSAAENKVAPQSLTPPTLASSITPVNLSTFATRDPDAVTPTDPLLPRAATINPIAAAQSAQASINQHPNQSSAHTPNAPAPQGEPAALTNGKASDRAVEVLQQRFELLGVDGDVEIKHVHSAQSVASASTSAALGHGNLVAPGSLAALANQANAVGNPGAQNNMTNGAVSTPAGGLATTLDASQNFFGQGQGFGSGAGLGGQNALLNSDLADTSASLGDGSGEISGGFGALISNQANPLGVPKPITAPTQMSAPLMVTPDQVAVTIAAAARNGERQISLQLRPAALGRIDIQLSVGRDGAVRARVLAERQETLDVLQRDANGLEIAIQAAGLHAETGGLSFGLKNGNGQDNKGWGGASTLPAGLLNQFEDEPLQIGRNPQFRASHDGRALDIRV